MNQHSCMVYTRYFHIPPYQCTQAYVMSVVMVVNEKWRERVPAWGVFETMPDNFPLFFQKVLDACLYPLEVMYSKCIFCCLSAVHVLTCRSTYQYAWTCVYYTCMLVIVYSYWL